MSTMAKCTICDQELDIRGMRMHMTKHNIEQNPVQTNAQNSTLEDSNKLKNDLATLSDSIRTKDADIALLNDSIKQKDVEFEQVKAELEDATSLEHEQNIVRDVLKKLTPEAYELIGRQLGFVSFENSVELGDKETISTIHESLVNGQRRQMVSQIKKYGLYDFWQAYKDYLYGAGMDDAQAYQYFSDAVISYFRIATQGKMNDSTPGEDPGEAPGTTITTDNQEKVSKLEDRAPAPDEYIFIGDKKQSGWKFYPEMGFSLKLS